MDRIVQASESFSATVNGVPVIVAAGSLYYSGDPVIKGREHLFGDVTILSTNGPRGTASATGSESDSETAVATPGTRRRMSKAPATTEAAPSEPASPNSSEV